MCLAAEGIELAAVALELLALGLDDLGRRVRDEPLVREHPLRRARPPCAAARSRRRVAVDLAAPGGRRPRRCARSSSEPSSTWTPLRRKICAASCTRSSAPRRRRTRWSGSGHGETIRRASRAGSCDQISSVTCGITGCSSASSRSSAASAVASRVLVAVVEPRLDRLRVPVAEVVEREVVEHRRRRARSRTRRGSSSSSARAASSRARIQRSSSARGRCLRLDVARVREDQPRDVPELDRELAALLDRAVREARRPASRTILSSP